MKGDDGVSGVGTKRRKPSYAWITANDASPESQSDKVELTDSCWDGLGTSASAIQVKPMTLSAGM